METEDAPQAEETEATNPNVLPADASQSPAAADPVTTPPGKTAEEWEGFQSEAAPNQPQPDPTLAPAEPEEEAEETEESDNGDD